VGRPLTGGRPIESASSASAVAVPGWRRTKCGCRPRHRVLIAAAQFSNHRMQSVPLPLPSRYDLDLALRKSEFDPERAKEYRLPQAAAFRC